MYGSGYALGLVVAVVFGLFLEYLRRKHQQNRLLLKKQQIAALLQRRIDQKRQAFKEPSTKEKQQL